MLLFLDLNVRYDPVVELGRYPKAINTEGDDGKEAPDDPTNEKTAAGTGKFEMLAGNYRVLEEPLKNPCNCPRGTKTKCNTN